MGISYSCPLACFPRSLSWLHISFFSGLQRICRGRLLTKQAIGRWFQEGARPSFYHPPGRMQKLFKKIVATIGPTQNLTANLTLKSESHWNLFVLSLCNTWLDTCSSKLQHLMRNLIKIWVAWQVKPLYTWWIKLIIWINKSLPQFLFSYIFA